MGSGAIIADSRQYRADAKFESCGSAPCGSSSSTIDDDGRSGANNPLTKLKVRQAGHLGIERATMAKQADPGRCRVKSTRVFPEQFGGSSRRREDPDDRQASSFG